MMNCSARTWPAITTSCPTASYPPCPTFATLAVAHAGTPHPGPSLPHISVAEPMDIFAALRKTDGPPADAAAPHSGSIRTTPPSRQQATATVTSRRHIDIWAALRPPDPPGQLRATPTAPPQTPAGPTTLLTWADLLVTLSRFTTNPAPAPLRGLALAVDARRAGADFPEIDEMALGAAEASSLRSASTRAGHVGIARRWIEWSEQWSLPLRSTAIQPSLHLVLSSYIRARRAVVGCRPPPSPRWPRCSRHPSPGPYVSVSSLDTEVSRFLGLLDTLHVPHPPYGGPLPRAVLTAFGSFDKHHRSNKYPLWTWQLIATFQALWSTAIRPSADDSSGFCLLALICIGLLRPGFASSLTSRAVSIMPSTFGLPAVLVTWFGRTKTRPERVSADDGGPGPAAEAVVTCIAHDIFLHTVIPFLTASRHHERTHSPLFPRCRRVPDASMGQASRHLFTWCGSQLWEATGDQWTHASLTRLARELLRAAGFPDALPFASGPHAGRLASNIELEELGFLEKVRDNLGQWAVAKRRTCDHYGAVAIERMARATASLGRLPLASSGLGAVSLGLPAHLDIDSVMPLVRRLGPVDSSAPPGHWIPDFVASLAVGAASSGAPPPPPPEVEPIPFADEDGLDPQQDDLDEQEAIWAAAAAAAAVGVPDW